MAEQSDPFFAPADLLIITPTFSIEIPAQEMFVAKVQKRVEKAFTTRPIDKNLY